MTSKGPDKNPKKKKNMKPESDSTREDDIDSMPGELISSILDAELENYVTKKKLDHKSATLLSNILKEHLSCFLILGYDYKGNPTTLLDCKTQKDSDSLNTLLQKYVLSHTLMGKA
jgi:hypothetical protein